MNNLPALIVKCHARVLLDEHEESQKSKNEMMQVDGGAGSEVNKKEVKIDNLYDIIFDGAGHPKSEESQRKKVVISGDRIDFLEQHPIGSNVQFIETMGGKKVVEVDKLKISKQFKLVNPAPQFQSVPATPQFFDLAGAHLAYPSLKEPMGKYKGQQAAGGIFKKLTGFFGRS